MAAAKRLGADVALFGEVKRTGSDLILQPRFVEVRGDKIDRRARSTPWRSRMASCWTACARCPPAT